MATPTKRRRQATGSPSLSVDDLLKNYGVPDEPLVVLLPKGEKLEFNIPSSLDALKETLKAAVKWYGELPQGKDAKHPLSPFIPKTREAAIDAFLIHTFSSKPRIGLKDACRLVEKAGWAAFAIAKAIREHWRDMDSLWLAEMALAEKKSSEQTNGDGPS